MGIATRKAAFLASRVVVMSPRPGRILEDRTIDFARPRQLDITFEPDFTKIVQELRAKILRPPASAEAAP